jgi:hypothetical protein
MEGLVNKQALEQALVEFGYAGSNTMGEEELAHYRERLDEIASFIDAVVKEECYSALRVALVNLPEDRTELTERDLEKAKNQTHLGMSETKPKKKKDGSAH